MDGKEIEEDLNKEIARQLILDIDSNATEDDVQKIWEDCQGNPWNAGLLYSLNKMAKGKPL